MIPAVKEYDENIGLYICLLTLRRYRLYHSQNGWTALATL